MKIKYIALVLAAVLMMSVMTNCSSKDVQEPKLDPKNPVSIVVWHYYNGTQKRAFDQFVSEFNDTLGREKGIIVDAMSLGGVNDLADGVKAAAAKEPGAEKMPDIFASYADNAFEIDKLGLVASVNKYLTEEEKGEYIDSFIDEGIFYSDGEIKILPTLKSTECMYLNKTDWDKFIQAIEGDDRYVKVSEDDFKTWEGIVKISEVYYNYTDDLTPEVKGDGKSFFGVDSVANYMLISSKQLGYDLIDVSDGNGKFVPEEDVLRKLWDNFYVPHLRGWFNAVNRFRSEDTKVGRILASIGSTSSCTYFPDKITLDDGSNYDIEAAIYSIPVFAGGEKYCVQQGAGMVVAKSTSEREYASVVFIKWLTENERNTRFALESGYLPVKKESIKSDFIIRTIESMEENGEIPSLVKSAMSVSASQIEEYTPFTNKPYNGGTLCRKVLEQSLTDQINASKEKLSEMTASGIDRNDALEELCSDEMFSQWLKALTEGLNDALK